MVTKHHSCRNTGTILRGQNSNGSFQQLAPSSQSCHWLPPSRSMIATSRCRGGDLSSPTLPRCAPPNHPTLPRPCPTSKHHQHHPHLASATFSRNKTMQLEAACDKLLWSSNFTKQHVRACCSSGCPWPWPHTSAKHHTPSDSKPPEENLPQDHLVEAQRRHSREHVAARRSLHTCNGSAPPCALLNGPCHAALAGPPPTPTPLHTPPSCLPAFPTNAYVSGRSQPASGTLAPVAGGGGLHAAGFKVLHRQAEGSTGIVFHQGTHLQSARAVRSPGTHACR